MNHTSPVGTGDGPGPDLGLDPGIGNARGIKEDIEEELVVGKMIEIGIGMRGRGTRTDRIEAGPTERVVRAGTEEGPEESTVPWRNGWASDSPSCFIYAAPFKQSRSRNSVFMGKSSLQLPFAFTPDASVRNTLSDRPSFSSSGLSLVLVVHASLISVSVHSLDLIYLRFYDTHLQDLYTMAIISSYLTIYLRCSASQPLCLCVSVISSHLSSVCFQCLISLSLMSVNFWTRRALCQLYRSRCTTPLSLLSSPVFH